MFIEYSNEEQNYLMNFWEPKIGDNIKDLKGMNHSIEKLEEGHEAQAHCNGKIVWLQDTEWEPTLGDILDIIAKQGGRIMPKFIRYDKCLFPRPSDCNNAIQILRTIRQLEMHK